MSPECCPSSFGSFQLTILEHMVWRFFKMATIAANGHHSDHLRCLNRMFLAILNLYVAPMPPIKFQLHPTYGLEGYVIWRISNGHSLGYLNGTILAILNFHVSTVPHKKFPLNLTYSSEADVIWKFSTLSPWRPSWILEPNNFSNSECPCALIPLTMFLLKLIYSLARNVVWRISRWPLWRPSWIYRNITILATLNLHVTPMPPTKFGLNQTYLFESRCGLKSFKMATVAAILDIGT